MKLIWSREAGETDMNWIPDMMMINVFYSKYYCKLHISGQ